MYSLSLFRTGRRETRFCTIADFEPYGKRRMDFGQFILGGKAVFSRTTGWGQTGRVDLLKKPLCLFN
jgi:hypothetical protein